MPVFYVKENNTKVMNDDLLQYYIEKYKIYTFFTEFEYWQKRIKLVVYPKKTYINYASMQKNQIGFFVKGRFKVCGNLSNGKEILYRFCKAFMILGEMDLLMDNPSDVEVYCETMEECHAVVLDYSGEKERLLKDASFLLCVCKSLAEKTSNFGVMQAVNTLQSAQAKVAIYILNTVGEQGVLTVNHRQIAENLNISYRHLHRILNKFVELRYLEHIDHYYRVMDSDGLKKCTSDEI